MTPTRRDIERRIDDAEAETADPDSPRELGWFDLLEFAKHCNEEGEAALSRKEFFGGPVVIADTEWARRLREASAFDE